MNSQPPGVSTEVGERVISELVQSELFVGYARDFGEFAGGTIELRAAATWPGCKITCQSVDLLSVSAQRTVAVCVACFDAEIAMAVGGSTEPVTVSCFQDVPETGVPVRIDESVIGFLVIRCEGRESALNSRRRAVAVRLLSVFAQHLSLLATELILRVAEGESSPIALARAFIDKHYAESLSLASAAKAARLSAVHFCRVFKKATGFGFSAYLARMRIDRAKALLKDRGLRVNEVANAVGFVSIPHFNRVFKRLAGRSPSEFRASLRGSR